MKNYDFCLRTHLKPPDTDYYIIWIRRLSMTFILLFLLCQMFEKFWKFYFKKWLTNSLAHSIIPYVSDKQIRYARVAQLVEHDLAKVGAAGSSPVSRSFYYKRTSVGCPFVINESCRTRTVRGLRSAPVGAKPMSAGHRAPSRALKNSEEESYQWNIYLYYHRSYYYVW